VTQEDSNSSEKPTSPPTSVRRFTVVVAVGVVGTEEDVASFRDIMVADFNARCRRAAEKLFPYRIDLLPVEETMSLQEENEAQ
jgi:hypothetical protein